MKKLTKEEKEIYSRCLGKCNICFNDGGCSIQDKLNKLRNLSK